MGGWGLGGGKVDVLVNSKPVIFFTFNSMNQMQLSHRFLLVSV